MPSTWILNATICTQDNKRRILLGHLRIEDGKIATIGTGTPRKKPGRNDQVIDASGLTILPGFVQTHLHLCQTLFRNLADDLELLDWLSKRIWIMEAAHTPETLKTSALLGIHELLSSGTTCILDMGTVRHTDAIFEAVRSSGIRASVGKCLMDHPLTTPPDLRDATEDALAEAKELYERWHGRENDRIRVSYAPRFVISCTEGLLSAVAKLSRDQNAIVHTHASENRKEIEKVRELTGRENVEYLHHLGLTSPRLVVAHCIWLNDDEKELLRKTGVHVTHCPSSNLKLASGLAQVPELRARGINVSLGADGAPCNNNLDMFGEMRLAALLHKPGSGPRAMRAQEVLDMATRDGARALGWQNDIGSIEVGKKADLVALDLHTPSNTIPEGRQTDPEAIASSIVYSSDPRHVRMTWVDGKLLYRKGRVTTIREAELMRRVRAAQDHVLKKARLK